ncbi:MAG: DUF3109 family protein [Methanococcaceae archaeon]
MFIENNLQIDGVTVRKDVTQVHFACDLKKCKGACCTMESQYGAPLLAIEIEKIQEILPIVMPLLPERHQEEIEKRNFWENKEGELLTRSVNNRACVFVYYQGDIAKCGIEKAFYEGKVDFIKPISCHLFPIRISKFGGDILRYEKIHECEPALENGVEQNITIDKFCKNSLIRLYGESWFEKLRKEIGS